MLTDCVTIFGKIIRRYILLISIFTIFNRCENTNDVLLAIPGWANVHPLLKVIPVEWEYSIPYGLLHSMTPSENVRRVLDAAKNIIKTK